MQIESGITKRYATALFNLALEKGNLESIDDNALEIFKSLKDNPPFIKFFSSPMVSKIKKFELLHSVYGSKIDPELLAFLKLIIHKQRVKFLLNILEFFGNMVDHYRGIEDVTIISAVGLDDDDYASILKSVQHLSPNQQLKAHKIIDRNILGGIILYLGKDKVIDGSLLRKMKLLKEELLALR